MRFVINIVIIICRSRGFGEDIVYNRVDWFCFIFLILSFRGIFGDFWGEGF